MRRAKIQVKPNLGGKVPSGSTVVAAPQDVSSSAELSEIETSSPTLSVEQPDSGKILTDLGSDQQIHTLGSNPNSTFSASWTDELHNTTDRGTISSVVTECDKSNVQNIGLESGEVNKTAEFTVLEPLQAVEHSDKSNAAVSPALSAAKPPARRLKSHWKPNLVKASTGASTVKPLVAPVLVPALDSNNIEDIVSAPSTESVAMTTVPCSIVENSAIQHAVEENSLAAIDPIDSINVPLRAVDGLTSPTSILRRGKFAAKPNVAKAARVRHTSVGEGCIVSASNTCVNLTHTLSAALPVTMGESRAVLATMTSLDQSTPSEDLDSEKTSAACSSVTDLSAEKVTAKMIERKIKQKKKRRQLEQLLGPIDRSTICIRDLIYMNPVNNPMKSPEGSKNATNASKKTSLEALSNVSFEKNPSQSPSVAQNFVSGGISATNEVVPDNNDENYEPVPQVKVGPDGKIILNFDSIIMEEKKSESGEKMEVVDECNLIRRGYPKKNRCRLWDTKETRKFYLLLSQIGTDFSLMCRLFPDRSRTDIKKKFKREEKIHHELIERALGERRGLDVTLLAEPCSASSSEDEAPKVKKVGRKRKGASSVAEVIGVEKDQSELAPALATATKKRRNYGKKDGKLAKRKPKKSLYYDSSSDGDVNPSSVALSSSAAITKSSAANDPLWQVEISSNNAPVDGVAKSISNGSSDEDEVEIIKQICGRPTKSGRLPRPTMKQADDFEPLPSRLTKISPSKRTNKSLSQQAESCVITSPKETASLFSPRSVIVGNASAIINSTLAGMPRTPASKPPMTPSHSITSFFPSPYLSRMVSPSLARNAAPGALSPGMLGVNRLPSGVYVVLESPQGSSAGGDSANGNQQVLYHIFAEMSPAQASQSASPSNVHVAANPVSPLIRPLHPMGQLIRPLHNSDPLIRPLNSVGAGAVTQHFAGPLIQQYSSPRAQNAGLDFRPTLSLGSPISSIRHGAVQHSVSVGNMSHQSLGYFSGSRPFSPRHNLNIQGEDFVMRNISSAAGSAQNPRYPSVFAYPGAPAAHSSLSSSAVVRAVSPSVSIQSVMLTNLSVQSSPQHLSSGKARPSFNSPLACVSGLPKMSQLNTESVGDGRSNNRSTTFEDSRVEQSIFATQQQDGTIVITTEKHPVQPHKPHSNPQCASSNVPASQNSERQQFSAAEADEADFSVAKIRVIEHEDGSTELLIDGGLYSTDGIQLENNEIENDESQYIDVVVEHYPTSDSGLT